MFTSLKRSTKIVLCLITWILYVFLHAISMYFIIDATAACIAVDALVHGGILAGLGFLLWQILRYGKYETLLPVQRFINYIALAILTLACWFSIGYFTDYLLLKEVTVMFFPAFPVRGMIVLLVYCIFILWFSLINREILESNNMNSEPQSPDTAQEIIDRITVKTGQKLHLIQIQEIMYIQSDGDYVQIATPNGKHLKEQTMKYFEMHLPQNQFVRIHRSNIVNIEYITRIESYSKQNQQITLKNGEWLKVSESGYKLLRAALKL